MLTYLFDIQRFADGGGDGSASSGTGTAGVDTGLSGDTNADLQRYFGISSKADTAPAESGSQGENTDEDEGSVTETESEQAQTPPAEQEADPDKEFEELIKGKYKDQFGKRTQGIINERFKASKQTEEQLRGLGEAIAPLYSKYGLEEGNIQGLAEAVKADKSMFSRQAMEAGQTTDAYRESFYSNREQARQQKQQKAQEAQQQMQQQMQQTFARWNGEAEELKKTYPEFDLKREIQSNPAFKSALEAGLPVAQAYYGANFDRLASGIAAAATQRSAKKTAETIAANASRPAEGGKHANVASKPSVDIANMTEGDIRNIFARTARGENVLLR